MEAIEFLNVASQKGGEQDNLVEFLIQTPEQIPQIFNGLTDRKANVKFGCAKVLLLLSERSPLSIYPYFDFFVKHLDHENQILKWNAILVLGNLTAADPANKFETIFDKFYAPITGPVMITAGNIIRASAVIVKNKPHLTERIAREFLKVTSANYKTPECRNIALGHAIESFSQFFPQIEDKEPVIELVKNQLNNPRSGTRKKAEKFVQKFMIG